MQLGFQLFRDRQRADIRGLGNLVEIGGQPRLAERAEQLGEDDMIHARLVAFAFWTARGPGLYLLPEQPPANIAAQRPVARIAL